MHILATMAFSRSAISAIIVAKNVSAAGIPLKSPKLGTQIWKCKETSLHPKDENGNQLNFKQKGQEKIRTGNGKPSRGNWKRKQRMESITPHYIFFLLAIRLEEKLP